MSKNKNYVAGRRFEYWIQEELERRGYKTIRASGSHGFADVIGVNQKDLNVLFISAKVAGGMEEVRSLLNWWKKEQKTIHLPISCSFECWVKLKGQKEPIAWRKE